ncbi:muconolactone Delta-isomerase family protein [Amycolatopsis sp. NPDC005232]|uniref:muconolactone Delta-isomerase n=1 Tax=Amycolatopsis sp. NPDC005232 TaxID=3157027 RepID=UPI0033A8297A
MLFCAHMTVSLPHDLDEHHREELLAEELNYFTALHRSGKWVHLWRIAGRRGNISVFDVESTEELHELLWHLPLFPFLIIEVTPLVEHPSLAAVSP